MTEFVCHWSPRKAVGGGRGECKIDESWKKMPVIVKAQRQYWCQPRIVQIDPLLHVRRSFLHVRRGKAFLQIQASNLQHMISVFTQVFMENCTAVHAVYKNLYKAPQLKFHYF